MTSRLLLLLVCLVPAGGVLGQDAKSLRPAELPDFWTNSYRPTPRDPFISAAALVTVFSDAPDARTLAAGESAQKILESIIAEVQRSLRVSGIASIQGRSRAIISGTEVGSGEKLLLPVPAETWSKLAGSARTYGIAFDRIEGPGGSNEVGLVLEVGDITLEGVQIRLPGFTNPLCVLRYDRRISLNPRRLSPSAQ